MAFALTPAALKQICKDNGQYTSAPELNDILHLQHRGITKLENLEAYTGLKTLYLECNAIDTIEGLSQAINLRCLYLGRNLIHEISGLASLVQLQTLDLSDNDIRRVEGLATLTELKTLNVSGNKLRTAGDIEHLRELPNLASLDLGKNRIDDESALEVVISLPLALLRMTGNPIVSSFRNYRKRLLVAMPQLNYLDDSPCTDADRRVARAFLVGGLEAERAERAAIRDEEAELREKHRQAFDDMVEAARANAAASPLPPADPMRFRAVPVGESESDEEGALPSKRPSRQPAAEVPADCSERLAMPEAAGAPAAADSPRRVEESQDSPPAAHGRATPVAAPPAPVFAPGSSPPSAVQQPHMAEANSGTTLQSGPETGSPGRTLPGPLLGTRVSTPDDADPTGRAIGDTDTAVRLSQPEPPAECVGEASASQPRVSLRHKAAFQPDFMMEGVGRGSAPHHPQLLGHNAAFQQELRERAAAHAASAAQQGDGPAQRSRPSEPQGQGRPLVWGTQQYGDLWQMALQVGAAQEADGDAGEEMSIRGGQTGATLRPSLSSHVMDSADDLWDAGWDAGSQSETSSDSDVDADPMERYSVTSTAQEPAVAQHSAARRAGLVDRQDSAHYEPRPVALVERRDSAHDLAPTPSTTAPLDLGRRDSAHEPQWSASPTDSSLGEAPLAELTPSPAARRAGASLRPSLLSHTSTSASLDSAMEEIAEEGSQHTDFSRHPDERQARIRRDSAAEPLTLARQVVAAAEGGRGSGRLASAQHMLGRPALRQDSALDPLVEARRAVLDDLHSNPPTSSLGSPGRPQSGTPEDSRNAHPGLLGESSPQEDSARDSLLETRRAALRAGPEPDSPIARTPSMPRDGFGADRSPRQDAPHEEAPLPTLLEARRAQEQRSTAGCSAAGSPDAGLGGFTDSPMASGQLDTTFVAAAQPAQHAQQLQHRSSPDRATPAHTAAGAAQPSSHLQLSPRQDSAQDTLTEARRAVLGTAGFGEYSSHPQRSPRQDSAEAALAETRMAVLCSSEFGEQLACLQLSPRQDSAEDTRTEARRAVLGSADFDEQPLRRDSAEDTLTEARRVVLEDLANNPPERHFARLADDEPGPSRGLSRGTSLRGADAQHAQHAQHALQLSPRQDSARDSLAEARRLLLQDLMDRSGPTLSHPAGSTAVGAASEGSPPAFDALSPRSQLLEARRAVLQELIAGPSPVGPGHAGTSHHPSSHPESPLAAHGRPRDAGPIPSPPIVCSELLARARQSVMEDLAQNPPSHASGYPQDGSPLSLHAARAGTPYQDLTNNPLLAARRAVMNELAQEELGPRSGCYPEARPVRRRDPGLDPAQDQLAEARRLILQDLADQPGPSGQVGPSLWPAGFPGDSASSSSRPDLWRDSPLQPILLARQAMHNSAAAAADSPDADAAGPSSSPTAGIPARHDSAHDLHELRRRQQQQHQQHRDMASTSSVQE